MRFIPVQLAIWAAALCLHAAEPVQSLTHFCAACGLLGVDTVLSETGEFIVHGYPPPAFEDPSIRTNTALIKLDPQLLAITAERTKRVLLQDLSLQDGFRGKIHMLILDRASPGQPLTLLSKGHLDGFTYHLAIPRNVENVRLIKGITQAVLLEMANRNSKRNAELPTWLVEGLTQELLTSITPTYVANRRPVTIETLGYDRLRIARAFFQSNSCLTINELSFQDISKFPAHSNELLRYQSSANLFVHELLRLPNGPALMSFFIQSLGSSLNWQTVFYQVYRGHFQRALDLEKWWAVTWLDFQNRREHERWPPALSYQKLEATLLTSLELRSETNTLPQRREVSLQEFLNQTDFAMQKAVLEQKLQQLYFLNFFLAPDASAMAAAYQDAMRSYIDQKNLSEYQPGLRTDAETRNQYLVKNAIKQFNELDRTLADLKTGKVTSVPKPTRRVQRQARR